MTQTRTVEDLKTDEIAFSGNQAETAPDNLPFPEPPASGSWVTDYAWISGLAGAVALVLCAISFSHTAALHRGVQILGVQLTQNQNDSVLLALLVITASMLVTEALRLWLRDRKNFFQLNPDLKAGRHLVFLREAGVNWLLYVCLLGLTVLFFQTAGEYGYGTDSNYYQIWFRFIELVFIAYLWAGLPYVLLTRALKHDPVADRRDISSLMAKLLQFSASLALSVKSWRPRFNEQDKKSARGLLVKLFFTPLMTVYFLDQFPHLVNNIDYIRTAFPNKLAAGLYTHFDFNTDFYNFSHALIFSIDVGLAWCGYVISSRWVDNQTVTAEPTMLGWMVCLVCYPPLANVGWLYYSPPSENMVFQLQHPTLISFFILLSTASIAIYMLATLWFGVRFSNVTNRGIIRKGPFAVVRHPAYASKNFFWWCLLFPVIIYNASLSNLKVTILMIIGLVLQSWIYYLRAITEERHLSADPYYQAYCQQVKYRFIPGVI